MSAGIRMAVMLAVSTMAAPVMARQASFDCAKARGFAEVSICASDRLASADRDLAMDYARLLSTASPGAAVDIRREQAAWLARRNACTSETCLDASYRERAKALVAANGVPDPAMAHRLAGTFTGVFRHAEYESALTFPEAQLSVDPPSLIRLSTARSPAVDRAVSGLTMIALTNGEAPYKHVAPVCSGPCRITGIIEQRERNGWWFREVTAVEALPDGFDFSRNLAVSPGPSRVRDIPSGDPLRRTLLDALRPVIERDLAQPVRFVVNSLRVQNGWAFAVVLPQTPAGKPVDFATTHHAERLAAGILDGGGMTYALLRLEAGKWVVRDFDVGPTDISYAAWPDDYGAPASLFGMTGDE